MVGGGNLHDILRRIKKGRGILVIRADTRETLPQDLRYLGDRINIRYVYDNTKGDERTTVRRAFAR